MAVSVTTQHNDNQRSGANVHETALRVDNVHKGIFGKLFELPVDGQIYGGFAQGVGTALYEEMPFDRSGQPLASTLADYLLPSAIEVPAPVLVHMETPAPYTEFGVKGIGEGGAIAPPAAIANAVNDALRPLGVELLVSPITPQRIIKAIAEQVRSRSMARID